MSMNLTKEELYHRQWVENSMLECIYTEKRKRVQELKRAGSIHLKRKQMWENKND